MKRQIRKLELKAQTLRHLAGVELRAARGAAGDPNITGPVCKETSELESIVYWCPDNTSIQRSCSGCTGSGTA